ncbi:MAG: PilZ domain-containing protein [Bacillota bacterium]
MQSSATPLTEHQVQLVKECAGRPARVSLFVPNTTQLLARIHGGIDEVELQRAIAIDCHGEVGRVPSGCPTVVEVMVRGELILLHTTFERADGLHALVLSWPHEVRTQQRRLHPRVDVELPLHFMVDGAAPTRQGMMNNLSAGGLAFTTADPIAPESELSIAFGLGSGFYLNSIQASVVRCTILLEGGYQVAVRFVDLPPATFAHLKEWVQGRLAEAGETGYR